MTVAVVLALLIFSFPVLLAIYAYRHRNDPLTWDEAYDRLKANDFCICRMCVGAHMRHGKR